MNTAYIPISIDDTSWIAAKQAASLTHGELNHLVTTLPCDQLSPPLLDARIAFDNAQSHLRHIQSERAKALNAKVREVSTDHLAQPCRLSGSAT